MSRRRTADDGLEGTAGASVPTDICPNSNPNPAQNVWHPVSDVTFEGGTGGLYWYLGGVSVLIA